ncbi:fumarylacetoacetate hydrolase family protein [bacterium]|nr:fumarylacetoacetate hydrolase family protein [bacterium]MBU1073224.1 fumarylacetoacetate hydrolase family protein [bacterium]MBU1675204.1 fumarylacetoacetate hydrolase family protein [bacterium]
MRLISFRHASGPRPGVALSDKIYLDILAADPELPTGWNLLFAHLDRVAELVSQWHEPGGVIDGVPLISSSKHSLLPPVVSPSKIIAVGLNYRDHAQEQNRRAPAHPLLFSKASTCLQAHEGPIVLDPDLTRVDAEAELAVVIGRAGRRISREDAASHIAGYMCFNDVTNREAQRADKQFFRGKSIDTGGPCGPWLVTPDELPPLAHGLEIRGWLNGEIVQKSNTDQLIFPVDELIRFASQHMTLLPGDIIASGTPAGVGVFRDPPRFLQPGDVCTVAIEGLGTLVNPVVSS